MTNQLKTEADLRCEIIDQLNLLDPALGAGGSRYIADKWIDAAREIFCGDKIEVCKNAEHAYQREYRAKKNKIGA